MSYVPSEGTIAARAIECIEKRLMHQPNGTWIANTDLSTALGVPSNAIRPSLDKAIAVGLVEKSVCPGGYLQWRLGYIKPRRRPTRPQALVVPQFSIDWPPGFVAQYDTVKVASYESRSK